jgi:hypothetical protein
MRTATPILVNGQFVVPVESYAEGTVSRAAQHVRTRRDFRGRSQPSVRCPRNRRNSNAARPGWSNPPQTTGQTAATATSTLTTFAIRFQLPLQCPGDETGWALAGRRLAAVRDTAVRRRNARLRRALSDQLSRAAVTGGTATLRRPGIRDPLLQRRSVQPDGECRFRIFIRWCRDLCAAGELIGNRHGLRPLSFAEALRLGCQQVYERNRAAGSWPPGNSFR